MSLRSTFALLVGLTLVSWAIPVWELVALHAASMVAVVTAAMFTAMLVAWPFLTGNRVTHGRMERARICIECHSLAWPTDRMLGFCLHCGSKRPFAVASY